MICPKCKKLLDDPKETCPHCGVIFAKVYAQKPLPANSNNKAESGGSGASTTFNLVPFLLGGILIIALVAWSLLSPSKVSDREERSPFSSTATGNCIAEIERQANFPSTVKWSIFTNETSTRPDGSMVIRVPFKAKNAFGMEINHVAICQSDDRGNILGINIVQR